MANKFEEKKIEAEALSELYDIMVRKEKEVHQEYKIVGKLDEQATNWQGELLWEDAEHTIPKMRDKWDTVEKEELSDMDNMKIAVYKRIMTALEKML